MPKELQSLFSISVVPEININEIDELIKKAHDVFINDTELKHASKKSG